MNTSGGQRDSLMGYNITIDTRNPSPDTKDYSITRTLAVDARKPSANAMDLRAMLNPLEDDMNHTFKDEVDGNSDDEANNFTAAKIEPVSLGSSRDRDFDDFKLPPLEMETKPLDDRAYCRSSLDQRTTGCKLPPLGMRMQAPNEMRHCISSLESTFNDCKLPPLYLDLKPENDGHHLSRQIYGLPHRPERTQLAHRRRSTPEARNTSRRSHSQVESCGINKYTRRLPIRNIRPQPRRSLSVDSRQAQWSSRSCAYRRRSDTYEGSETDSVGVGKKLKGPKPSHSNKPYTPEQVCWIRYMKEDCGFPWKALPAKFAAQFPDADGFDVRTSDQCFSSRGYRDNRRPQLDDDWNPILGEDGKVVWILAKVRERSTPEGRERQFPYTLVEQRPELAIKYSWVSREHKEMARRILITASPRDKKEKWRQVLRYIEAEGLA